MGTRSTIAVVHADGTVSQVYCHWDGYPSHNGAILLEHFTTLEKIEKLISLGDLSSLAADLGAKQDFDDPVPHTCVFYGRDRGETDVDAARFLDLAEYKRGSQSQEYDYLFYNNCWYVSDHRNPFEELHTVLAVEHDVGDV